MMIEPMVRNYAANLNDKEYKKLKSFILELIKKEDKKRGIKNG